MADREIINWAGSADAGDVADPGVAQEASGYAQNQMLPHDELNYILRSLSRRSAVYGTLESAAAILDAGQMALVDEYDPTAVFLAEIWKGNTGSVAGRGIDTDGRRVYVVVSGTQVRAFSRSEDPASPGQGLVLYTTPTHTSSFLDVSSDGHLLAAASGDGTIQFFDPDDGALLGEFDRGTTDDINAVYCYGDGKVLWGGVRDGVGAETHGHLTVTKSPFGVVSDWAEDHGAEVHRIKTDGRSFQDYTVAQSPAGFLVGAIGTSSYTIQRFALSDGALQAGNTEHAQPLRDLVITDGAVIAVGDVDATFDIRAYHFSLASASTYWEKGYLGDFESLAWDGRWLYVGGTNGGTAGDAVIAVLDPRTGFEIKGGVSPNVNAKDVVGLVVDGLALFMIADMDAGAFDTVRRLNVLEKPRWFRRVDEATDPYRRPWNHMMLPVDIW